MVYTYNLSTREVEDQELNVILSFSINFPCIFLQSCLEGRAIPKLEEIEKFELGPLLK